MHIDPNLRGKMPRVEAPAPWTSKDGKHKGWKVSIPGGRPLATPAVARGRIFIGGGFGSYDFYAFDARTGRLAWQYQTEDDGPTAAAVADEFVAFNTESCELEVLTLEGRRVWKKWLGDPLMSMPAIHEGRIYQVYPDTKGDRRHYIAAFELQTGRELWKQPLSGEIITAPVIADGHVYTTNLDGTLSCFRADTGEPLWQDQKNATSSPVVASGQCYYSKRREQHMRRGAAAFVQQMEGLAMRGRGADGATQTYEATVCYADYLDHAKRQMRSPHYAATEAHDAKVGFGGMHKGDAKMEQARANLGHSHVSSLWAYQGSKPFLRGGRLYAAVGDTLHAADPDSQEVFWKQRLYNRPEEQEVLDHAVTPPALANGKLFVGTLLGELCCLASDSGEVLWRAGLDEPVVFQPAVVEGRAYTATASGSLFAIETGDEADDGWHMWGGDACHNGSAEHAPTH